MKTKTADAKETELHAVEKKLTTMLSGIDTLFKLFKCHNDPIIQMLGKLGFFTVKKSGE